jgi:hypothetical protein
MDRARVELSGLLASVGAADLSRRTNGTRWTNEQLLFHMVFGYLIVRTLLPLVRLVSRLPSPVGRGFASLLDRAAPPFHVINYWGSVGGAVVFNHDRMGWLLDHTVTALQRRLQRETEATLRQTMPFPTRWDPYFAPRMTVADVYRYANQHFEHHRRQLTLGVGT